MIISLIVAMDRNRGIGKAGKLPWRLSTDMKRFRELTMGHHLIAGRKTFESIGKPLPGRQTIIVTRDFNLNPEGCLTAASVPDAIALARERGESEVFVIGGAQIYAHALDAANRIYLTEVHADVDADTFFPEINGDSWSEKSASYHPPGDRDQYASTFKLLERKTSQASAG